MNTTIKKISYKYLLVFLILLTASFDIVAAVKISGLTVRISQLFIILGIFHCFVCLQRITFPIGMKWLGLWLVFQFIAAFNCSNYKYSFGYFAWTLLSIGIIFLFHNIFNSPRKANLLCHLYIYSIVAMALLGLLQFCLKMAGINFFLTQPWLNGAKFGSIKIPRLNGFTYEPSYYSTYLLPGWIFIVFLFEKGSVLLSKRKLGIYSLLVTAALFLCTSRMGWIFMALWVAFRSLVILRRILSSKISKFHFLLLVAIIVCILLAALIALVLVRRNGINFLITGLGIGGSSSHSSSPRINALIGTMKVFLDSPLIGYSLGGISVEYCNMYHIPMDTGATMCVWMELLAASGIIGIVLFAFWFYELLFSGMSKNKLNKISAQNELRGLFYAVIFECLILAINQNILRVYFWTLLAVFDAVKSCYSHTTRGCLSSSPD